MATDILTDSLRDSELLHVQLPDRYEVIDGQVVEMKEMSTNSTVIGTRLTFALTQFGLVRNLGEAHPDTLFKLPLPVDRNRRPDVAFVPFSRWARHRRLPTTNAWNVLPELAVEVVSPNDLVDELMEKVKEYFDAGVTRVWVVYPRLEIVHVYETFTQIVVLTRQQELTGEPFLPGFRLPITDLFPSGEEPPTQPA